VRCAEALWQQFEDQGRERLAADDEWDEHGLVFSSAVDRPLDATSVRSRTSTGSAPTSGRLGISGTASCPRSPTGASRWKRSPDSSVLRPVIQTGAVVMDGIFGAIQQR
jgi:hypothetical protein